MTLVHIDKSHFHFDYIIGRGGFGKVWKVTFKKTNEEFAMKIMLKSRVIDKNSVKAINNEREILALLKNE